MLPTFACDVFYCCHPDRLARRGLRMWGDNSAAPQDSGMTIGGEGFDLRFLRSNGRLWRTVVLGEVGGGRRVSSSRLLQNCYRRLRKWRGVTKSEISETDFTNGSVAIDQPWQNLFRFFSEKKNVRIEMGLFERTLFDLVRLRSGEHKRKLLR